MMYRAIQSVKCKWAYVQRDNADGIIGELTDIADEIVLFSSDSKDEVMLKIKAYFYDNPNKTVYLVDDANRVYGIFRHKGEDDARGKLSEFTWFFYCLSYVVSLNIAFAAGIGSVRIDHSVLKLFVIVVVMTLLYVGIVKAKIQNCIEGAVVVTIFSVLGWLIIRKFL